MSKPTFIRIVRLAWPVLVAQMAVVGSGVIDTLMAGRLSALDLAAVGVGNAIYITVFMTSLGVLLALTPTVAQHYGAARYLEIGEDVRQSTWLALLLSIVGILFLRHPEPFLLLAQLTPAMEEKVRAYLDALSWGLAPAMVFRIFYGFMSGIGRPRAIMAFNLLGLAAKVPLNALFMFSFDMGAAGCGAATSAIGWTTAVLAWTWCAREPSCAEFGVLSRLTLPKPTAMLALARLGLPIGITLLVDVTGFTFMALFIARLGPATSAAHQIASNLAIVIFMVPLSIGNASLVLAGQALGANDAITARRTGLMGVGIGVLVAVFVSTCLWLGAGPIAGLYTPDTAVRATASGLIAIVAVYHLADALQTVVVNVLRGYKKTVVPMAAYVVSLWGVGLGGGYLLGLTDLLGPARGAAGFWIAAAASLALAGLIMTSYYLAISRAAVMNTRTEYVV
ncbi:MAG TPA: MATE family efflux transporter [Rhodocyclaceae bacterium]|nr:MATE family efflux transporter [Rhodocyclaceae bacterium]